MAHPLVSETHVSTLLRVFQETRAVQFGDFTLSSGRKSNLYVNARKVTLHRTGLFALSAGFHEIFSTTNFDVVGGPTSAADPILGGILTYAEMHGLSPCAGFFWRKEPKAHGTKDQLEGHCPEGASVILVDDTATTGGSILQVAEYVRNVKKAVVATAFVLVDRLEGAKELLASHGIELHALLTKDDFPVTYI